MAICIVFRISILLPGSVWRSFHILKLTFKTLLHLWWEIKQEKKPNQNKEAPQNSHPRLCKPQQLDCVIVLTKILIICPLIPMFYISHPFKILLLSFWSRSLAFLACKQQAQQSANSKTKFQYYFVFNKTQWITSAKQIFLVISNLNSPFWFEYLQHACQNGLQSLKGKYYPTNTASASQHLRKIRNRKQEQNKFLPTSCWKWFQKK